MAGGTTQDATNVASADTVLINQVATSRAGAYLIQDSQCTSDN